MSFPKGNAYVESHFVVLGHESFSSIFDTFEFESVLVKTGDWGDKGRRESNFVRGGGNLALDIQIVVVRAATAKSHLRNNEGDKSELA